jgi:Leucine-rich repeat (LRR) protein
MASKREFEVGYDIEDFTNVEIPDGVECILAEGVNLRSFKGLENTNITEIQCTDNQIESFEYLPGTLKELNCSFNNIKTFKYLPSSVVKLDCSYNKITSFEYLPESVVELECNSNRITSFVHLPISVNKLHCYGNKIKSFDTLQNRNISIQHGLFCHDCERMLKKINLYYCDKCELGGSSVKSTI